VATAAAAEWEQVANLEPGNHVMLYLNYVDLTILFLVVVTSFSASDSLYNFGAIQIYLYVCTPCLNKNDNDVAHYNFNAH